jgi:hypothetical protein
LSFYKICFLTITYKNWFLNKSWVVGVCRSVSKNCKSTFVD